MCENSQMGGGACGGGLWGGLFVVFHLPALVCEEILDLIGRVRGELGLGEGPAEQTKPNRGGVCEMHTQTRGSALCLDQWEKAGGRAVENSQQGSSS